MDHVVYLDAKAKELEKLLSNEKTMIIRGATGRKLPYGRVNKNDILYFINNNGEGEIRVKADVSSVFDSDMMTTEESVELVTKNNEKLKLSDAQFKKWAGKRYIVLIEVKNVEKINPFSINKSGYSNMDDWLPVENINKVKN